MRVSLRRLIPDLTPISPRERLRSAGGAFVGILATGLVSRAALGDASSLPVLIAPMGASAVLLFAVPSSPLAQPWSIVGGNLVAGLVGVSAAAIVPDPFFAAAIAICGAIGLMMALRCVHPPSGAVALTAVLGGPAIRELGFGFVLWPVAANSLLLLAAALIFNNLTGRSYPHVQARAPAASAGSDAERPARSGVAAADLDAALKELDLLIDVDRGDLETILHHAQIHSYRRRSGQTRCAQIMTRDVVAVAPEAPLAEALELIRRHHVKALPVTDESARVVGIVTQTDLLDKAEWDIAGPHLGLGRRLRLTLRRGRAPYGAVEDVMTSAVRSVGPDAPLGEVVLKMSAAGIHHLPVVGPDGRLVGIVSQTDVVAGLLADAEEETERRAATA